MTISAAKTRSQYMPLAIVACCLVVASVGDVAQVPATPAVHATMSISCQPLLRRHSPASILSEIRRQAIIPTVIMRATPPHSPN
jgi:hypothetical protein